MFLSSITQGVFHILLLSTESALINHDNVFKNEKRSYEIIVIDDGSNRAAFQEKRCANKQIEFPFFGPLFG